MPATETLRLDREIHVFCRYLIGRSPDGYVMSRYRKAHEVGALGLDGSDSRFDKLVVRIARISPTMTRVADAYITVCAGGALRRKLVLSLGILENSPAHQECFTFPPDRSRAAFLVAACGMTSVFVVNVLVGLLVFLPLRVACRLFGKN